MKSSGSPHVAGGVLLLAASLGLCASDQTTVAQNPPLVISSLYGRDLLEFYITNIVEYVESIQAK